MEAATFKDKKQGIPAENEDDPDYVNINLTCRNWGQSKGSRSPPKNQAPARCRPPADAAQAPRWSHGATLSLCLLVALCCITVSALVLAKHPALSQELLDLKRELGNISASVGQCQEEQQQSRIAIRLSSQEAKKLMDMVKNNIQNCIATLKTLSSDIKQIKAKLQDISKKQGGKPEPGVHPTQSPKLNK
ncbi:Mast cell-expressed membrane protein 1 [Manis javanica]|nr:Mast cell-expressed membrane protein 1 [Manis javanica]